jgi:hypothetical protein
VDLDRIAAFSSDPRHVVRAIVRRWPQATFEQRLRWDGLDRPHYAYGIWLAATEAKALDLPAISVVELGVAGGNGLVTMEWLAAEVAATVGIGIEVYGFDAAGGMPPTTDNRDLPYVWQPGMFPMDEAALRRRLRRAHLVLGDVSQTVPRFVAEGSFAPLGFLAYDLDYYSSTVAAFGLLEAPPERRLPRIVCYFDDIIGDDFELHSPFAGELLAIEEFNAKHDQIKISQIHGLRHKRRVPARWNDQMYAVHDFAHPLYSRPVHPAGWDLGLRA